MCNYFGEAPKIDTRDSDISKSTLAKLVLALSVERQKPEDIYTLWFSRKLFAAYGVKLDTLRKIADS